MDSVIIDGFKQKILPKAYYVGDRKLIDIRNYIDEQEIDELHKKSNYSIRFLEQVGVCDTCFSVIFTGYFDHIGNSASIGIGHNETYDKSFDEEAEIICKKLDSYGAKFKTPFPERCPICGAQLSRINVGYSYNGGSLEYDLAFSEGLIENMHSPEDLFNAAFQNSFDKKGLTQFIEKKWNDKIEPLARAKFQEVIDYSAVSQTENSGIVVTRIKSDPDQLKQYIKHAVDLETEMFELKDRMLSLYYFSERLHVSFEIAEKCNGNAIIDYENNPELVEISNKLQGLLERCDKEYFRAEAEERYSDRAPGDEPSKPQEPVLKTPNIFNKKKVESENALLMKEYEQACGKYKLQMDEFLKRKNDFSRLVDQYCSDKAAESRQQYDRLKETFETQKAQYLNAEKSRLLVNPYDQPCKLIESEIIAAKQTYYKLVEALANYYSLDIVFGKYRNLVALTRFYEYLLAGRCKTLEGADGAYNIYESEIRMDALITDMGQVLKKLDDIKKGQYLLYEQLVSANKGINELNNKTATAIDQLVKIGDSVDTIKTNSYVIAYNTAQTAFYAKTIKNIEIASLLIK